MRVVKFSWLLIVLLSIISVSLFAGAMAEEVQDVGEAVVDEAVVGENNVVVDEAADVTVAEGAAESMTEGAAEGAAGGAAQGVTRKDKPKKRMRGPHMGVMGGKQIWNDCVGMSGEEVVRMIKQDRPDLRRVFVMREGAPVTMDLRMDRVRVFINQEGIVTRPPRVG